MAFLQQHPDSLRRDIRSLPDPQLGSDLPQQIQNCVAVLPVLQFDPMVFSRHSDTGEPGEDVHKKRLWRWSEWDVTANDLHLWILKNIEEEKQCRLEEVPNYKLPVGSLETYNKYVINVTDPGNLTFPWSITNIPKIKLGALALSTSLKFILLLAFYQKEFKVKLKWKMSF